MIPKLLIPMRRWLAVLLAGPMLALAAPQPVVVAESEAFEIVGRLAAEGLVLHVDRAPSNEPVLAASLEIETAGRTASAVFRPASGDYLVADAAWLAPLRQAGEHVLALTLIAGDDGDLLSGELLVAAEVPAAQTAASRAGLLLALSLLVGVVVIGRRLRHLPGGGA